MEKINGYKDKGRNFTYYIHKHLPCFSWLFHLRELSGVKRSYRPLTPSRKALFEVFADKKRV